MRHAHITYVTDPHTGRRWPIPAGGADDNAQEAEAVTDDPDASETVTDEPEQSDETDGSDDSDDEPLGPAGEKALREMKKRARAAERELRKLQADLESDAKEDTADPDELRKQIETEIRAEAAKDRALDKLEAKAARKFQNPDLARKLLADQADDFLDEKGNPDVEAINEALDELLHDEPYLAVQDGRTFQGKADSGARNGSGKAGQLTREDLRGMSREEIVQAEKEGRLDVALGRS